MNRSSSPWLKAGLATLSVSVVGAVIAAFSYASDAPSSHSKIPTEPIQIAVHAASPEFLPASKEITRQMILDRTASCAEMISAQDKLRCLNKRLQLKREFRAQEKGKCNLPGNEAGRSQCPVDLDALSKSLRAA